VTVFLLLAFLLMHFSAFSRNVLLWPKIVPYSYLPFSSLFPTESSDVYILEQGAACQKGCFLDRMLLVCFVFISHEEKY